MSSRESKNPVSGRKLRPGAVIAFFLFFLFSTASLLLLLWSYRSAENAGALSLTGPLRIGEWLAKLTLTPLCSVGIAWRSFLSGDWKLFLAAELGVMLLFWLLCRRFGGFYGVEYGSAHWATRWELRPFRLKKEEAAIPIAENLYLTERAHPANRNILAVASPGGGKSFNVIIPAIEAVTRKSNGSFFCTDTKGAIFRDTCRMMEGRGMKTRLLNLANPWYSDRYNPLENIHEEKKYTEISGLALAYAKNVRDEEASVGDSIWEDTFRALLTAIWAYQYDYETNPVTGRPETRAMWRTAELVRSLWVGTDGRLSSDGELARLTEAIRAGDPLHPTVENYDFIAAGAAETVASVIFTAGSKINIFTFPEVQALTEENDIDIDKICEEPTGVYLNFEIGSPYRAIAALFIEQLFSAAYYLAETKYGGRLPQDLTMCLDELPNICKVYSLPERASTSRSYGINLILSVQSMQQLERMFHKAEETLKNNCVTHIYLGTSEPKALEEISKNLGKTTTEEVSRSKNTGAKGSGGSESDKAVGRELIFPAELTTMPDKYAIVKIQHYPPIFARKFPTIKQPWYPELGGIGCPENSRTIEDAYRITSAIRKARYYDGRLRRAEAIRAEQRP